MWRKHCLGNHPRRLSGASTDRKNLVRFYVLVHVWKDIRYFVLKKSSECEIKGYDPSLRLLANIKILLEMVMVMTMVMTTMMMIVILST